MYGHMGTEQKHCITNHTVQIQTDSIFTKLALQHIGNNEIIQLSNSTDLIWHIQQKCFAKSSNPVLKFRMCK